MRQKFLIKKIEDEWCLLMSSENMQKSQQKCLTITDKLDITFTMTNIPTIFEDQMLFKFQHLGNNIFTWTSKKYGNILSIDYKLFTSNQHESKEMWLINYCDDSQQSIFDKKNKNCAKFSNISKNPSEVHNDHKRDVEKLAKKQQVKQIKEKAKIAKKIDSLEKRMNDSQNISEKRNNKIDRLKKR